VLLKVTALIALDDLYRRSSNRQATAMMTIQVMEVLAKPSRAVRASRAAREAMKYFVSQKGDLQKQHCQLAYCGPGVLN
jgi:hypothetical protein